MLAVLLSMTPSSASTSGKTSRSDIFPPKTVDMLHFVHVQGFFSKFLVWRGCVLWAAALGSSRYDC